MSTPLVTIIIPVYNVADYLENCLISVQKQTYPELEVFLINDGSRDASLDICQAFAHADDRFRLIDKPNTGVSDSRNQALNQAHGKYVQFVDGDDWLASNATETFVHAAESTGCDMVISHFYRVSNDRIAPRGHIRREAILTRQEYAEEMIKAPANYYYGVLWNKFFRRSIIEAHHLRCPVDVTWCEDFLFNLNYIQYARLITAVSVPLYYYRKREGSLITSQASLRKTAEMKRSTFAYYKELYQKLDLYEEQKAKVYGYLISAATDGALGPLSFKLEEEQLNQ